VRTLNRGSLNRGSLNRGTVNRVIANYKLTLDSMLIDINIPTVGLDADGKSPYVQGQIDDYYRNVM